MRVVGAVRVEVIEKEKVLEQQDAKLTALQGGALDFLQPPSVHRIFGERRQFPLLPPEGEGGH